MKKLKSYEIRQMWLDFFESKGHKIIESASLLPHEDPTLLWINAGVTPLKKFFDGREKPENPRMCNAQKSIRTNDIDNVGRTSRHHTFFEMLGNFSIGDYFREEVITWASELLFDDKWFGIPKESLYITYYPKDVATYEKWKSVGIEEDHLIPLEDNFWEIGEGPCGPDTEMFFDRGENYDPEHLGVKMLKEDIDNDRYIEIWNIVFSQFNSVTNLRREDYPELPSKNIDTGSGLERLTCIFQETDSNYETDLFLPLLEYIEKYSGHKYDETPEVKMAFRVIADHIRSVTFAVADGASISNEGRGYVLRRILRRAVRYGRKLGITTPFLYKMVSIVVNNMNQFYTYLNDKQSIVERIIRTEEENFLKTLENGEKKLSEIIKNTISSGSKSISGKDAFLLYDTFGFPIELTEETAAENGLTVEIDKFNCELNAQKVRARNARNDEQSMNVQNEDYLNFDIFSEFIGYDSLSCATKVVGIFENGKRVNFASGEIIVVLEKTPFYAEMGGQVGDMGRLSINSQDIVVSNTFKLPNGQHAHVINTNNQTVAEGDEVIAYVNEEFRKGVCSNHSATHLLNESLRKVLGSHVIQHGSLVTDERLRFDFNHYSNLTNEEILKIENLTNQAINENYPVNTLILSIEDAKKTGAQAVFGEKYGDVVRVVDMAYSKEFCGGTHVLSTGEILKIAITSIESKGSGIFRIEAITGDNILSKMDSYLKNIKDEIITIIEKTKSTISKASNEGIKLDTPLFEMPEVCGSYQDILNYKNALELARKNLKNIEREYDNQYRNQNSSDYKKYLEKIIVIDEKNIIIEKVTNVSIDVLKDVIDKLAAELNNCVIFFADIISESKVIFIAKSKNNNVNCGLLVKTAAIIAGGAGGGRADFAQSGGKDSSKVDDSINKVWELVK